MANVGTLTNASPDLRAQIQNIRHLHARLPSEAVVLIGGEIDQPACFSRRERPANRGGFDEKVKFSAAIMVGRICVNFGRLRHQIMVG